MNQNKVKITRLVDRMGSKELILREATVDDKRFKNVQLSEKGKRYYFSAEPIAKQVLEQAFKGFSETEYIQLMALCNRVVVNLKETK